MDRRGESADNIFLRQRLDDLRFHGDRNKIATGAVIACSEAHNVGIGHIVADHTILKDCIVVTGAERLACIGMVQDDILLIIHKYLCFLTIMGCRLY